MGGGLLITQSIEERDGDATEEKEQRGGKQCEKGRKAKLVFERQCAGTQSKQCCMSVTSTQRGCSGGSGFCHVDVAEAEHSG